jgi:enoyl-CoA hydratase/carnithine racemase
MPTALIAEDEPMLAAQLRGRLADAWPELAIVAEARNGDEALAMARLIASNSPGGVRLSKRAIQRNQEITSYAAAMELENRGQALLTRTQDMAEALAAFTEGRQPRFTGQ